MSNKSEMFKTLEDNGFKIIDDYAVGMVNGIIVTVIKKMFSLSTVKILYSTDQTEVSADKLRGIERDATVMTDKNINMKNVDNQLQSSFNYMFKSKDEYYNIYSHIGAVTMCLNNEGINGNKKCVICQGDNCNSISKEVDTFKTVHSSCVHNAIGDDFNNLKNKGSNYLLATFGAVLGCLVGIIPALICTNVDILLGALSSSILAIPFATFSSYKKLNGKLGWYSIILTVSLSLMGVVLIWYLTVVNMMLMENGGNFTVAFETASKHFFEVNKIVELLKNSKLEVITIFIGLVGTWNMISKTEKSDEKKKENSAASMISINSISNRVTTKRTLN